MSSTRYGPHTVTPSPARCTMQAVFLRDPFKRMLSCYLDKFRPGMMRYSIALRYLAQLDTT